MRIILFFLLAAPFVAHAQLNRSANELAHENIKEYITEKLFKDQAYKPVSYDELKPYKIDRTDVVWSVQHKFEIAGTPEPVHSGSTDAQQTYKFIFYLDKKLRVLRAENIQ